MMWYAEDGIIDQGFVGYFSYSLRSFYLTVFSFLFFFFSGLNRRPEH